MPLTPEWATFFSSRARRARGADRLRRGRDLDQSRAHSRISVAAEPGRPRRWSGPVGAITATSLMLIPEQAAMLLGTAFS